MDTKTVTAVRDFGNARCIQHDGVVTVNRTMGYMTIEVDRITE